MLKLYIFIIAICLGSCTSHTTIQFPQNKLLHAEKVPINEIFDGHFLTVNENNLFIQSYRTDSMLFIYSVPNLKFIKATGKKGRGPGEFNMLKFVGARNNYIYLSGYSNPFLINKYKIDSLGNPFLINTFTCQNSKHTIFNQMQIIQDSILLYNNCAYGLGIVKYDLRTNKELNDIPFKEDNKHIPTCNSNWGTMTANDSVIVYVYSNKRQIDLYDVNTLALKKRIIGNYKYVKPSNPMTDIYYYVNVIGTDKYFYAMYCGLPYQESKENTNTLEVYDYEGNPIIKYSFDFSPSTEFCVDEKNGMIYSYKSQNGNQDFLLRYKMLE